MLVSVIEPGKYRFRYMVKLWRVWSTSNYKRKWREYYCGMYYRHYYYLLLLFDIRHVHLMNKSKIKYLMQ